MITLKHLKLKGFGSFKSEQTVVFPPSGLLLVHGENGSGKSSVFKAIAYCLDFLSEPASEFVNWDTQEDIQIELCLNLNAQDLIIKRGNGHHSLEFGSLKAQGAETVKKIKELLLLPDFLATMSYRGQDEAGNFSKLKPSEKQEMLSDLLALGDFDKLIENTEVVLAKLEFDLNKKTQDEASLFSNAESMVSSLDQESKLQDSLEEQIALLSAKIDSKKLDTQDIDTKISNKIKDKANLVADTSLDKDIKEKTAEDTQIRIYASDCQKSDIAFQKQVLAKTSDINSLNNELSHIPRIQKEIERLQKDQCPRCLQPWSESSTDLEKLESKLEDLEEVKKLLEQKQAELAEWNAQKSANSLKYKEFLDQHNAKVQEIENLKRQKDASNFVFKEHDQQIQALNNEKTYIVRQFNTELGSLKNERDSLLRSKTQFAKNLETNTKKIEEIDQKLELIKEEKESLKARIEEQTEILTATKDFLRLITEDTLKLISQESTKFIQNLPNATSFYINFNTSKLNKNGKTKKEIVLQVFKDGKEVPFRRLSGGEKCSVHLATDLAMSQVLAMRTGKNLGWFILDESLNGHSQKNKIEALGMLKAISDHKLILIAEHTSETQEIFDRVLNVRKTENGSITEFV